MSSVRITATFKGRDGSEGFKKGQQYKLVMDVKNNNIYLFNCDKPKGIPYTPQGLFNNWENIQEVK